MKNTDKALFILFIIIVILFITNYIFNFSNIMILSYKERFDTNTPTTTSSNSDSASSTPTTASSNSDSASSTPTTASSTSDPASSTPASHSYTPLEILKSNYQNHLSSLSEEQDINVELKTNSVKQLYSLDNTGSEVSMSVQLINVGTDRYGNLVYKIDDSYLEEEEYDEDGELDTLMSTEFTITHFTTARSALRYFPNFNCNKFSPCYVMISTDKTYTIKIDELSDGNRIQLEKLEDIDDLTNVGFTSKTSDSTAVVPPNPRNKTINLQFSSDDNIVLNTDFSIDPDAYNILEEIYNLQQIDTTNNLFGNKLPIINKCV